MTADEIARAERQRVALAQRMLAFFDTYDLLLCPSTIVAPFPIEERYLAACNGVTFETYIDWLAIAYAITLTCCPALSLPCGFTSEELPVGLQIVAPPRAEDRVLAGAKLIEDVLGLRAINADRPAHHSPKSAFVSHHARQPEHRLRHDGDDGQNDNRHQNKWRGLAHDRRQRLLGHVGNDEQQQAVRRRQQADHDVDHDHDAEMHQIDAERLGGRDEYRNDDEQNRGALQQAAEAEQDDVDQQQEAAGGQIDSR